MRPPSALRPHLRIWVLGFGYFVCYTPYSGLTKALAQGLLPGMAGPVSGFLMLPAVALATTVLLLVFVTLGGGWAALDRRPVLGWSVPVVRRQTFYSGVATAVIIGT